MVHSRFWKSMGERFGQRWFDAHGPRPTSAWCELLDQFSEDIDAALLRLKDRPERDRSHPPTHAEFQTLLIAASKARGALDNAQAIRAYWRTIAVSTALRHAGLLNLVSYGETRLERLPGDLYRSTLGVCQELVTWACEQEARETRTPAMEQHINSSLWNHLKPWARQGEFDTSHPGAPNRAPRGTSNTEAQT
jgi:hypothetical protein